VVSAVEQGVPEQSQLKLRDAFVSAPFIVLALTFFAAARRTPDRSSTP
jgi:hypothetical protein